MKLSLACCVATGSLIACALSVSAMPSSDLQDALDAVTVAPVAGVSSIDVTTDFVPEGMDALWLGGVGGSVGTFILELSASAPDNEFGIYDPTDMDMVTVFSGAAGPGDQSVISITADGSVFVNFVDTTADFAGNYFGLYLRNPVEGYTWYSETTRNADQMDRMFAYQGNNIDTLQLPGFAPGLFTTSEYVVAWEDGSDEDFTDMVLLVESVLPVPEPAGLSLIGLGVVLLALRRRFV